MFPPKIAESLEEGISNLWASLERGSEGQWDSEATIVPDGDNTRVALHLHWPLPETAKTCVAAYAKSYMLRSGWKVRSVKVTKRYVELVVSNV